MSQHEKLMAENYAMKEPDASSRLLTGEPAEEGDFFVDVTWLKDQIDHHADDFVLVDVTRGENKHQLDVMRFPKDYEEEHIPGAIHFSTDELGEFKGYLKEADELAEVFLSKGICKDTPVVFYSSYARDIMYIASRVAFAAYYLGVDQVRILDGGLQAWKRAGYPLESGYQTPKACDSFGCDVPRRSDVYIKAPQQLKDYKKIHPDAVLASVRSWNEFSAVNEGHHWNKGVGEIAGAVYAGDDFLTNELGYMSDPKEYMESFESWGIQPDADIILSCGTSWRASTAFFLLKHLGFQRVKVFDGSWFKWYQAHKEDPASFPIQMGNPRDSESFQIIKK